MSAKWFHIIVFSFFIIILFISRLTGKPTIMTDSYTYMATANAISEGNWYLEMWGRGPVAVPPLYPLLIGLGKFLLGVGNNVAAFLISVISSVLLILLVFLWAVRRFGWGWAWVASLLIAFNIDLTYSAIVLLTESLFTLLFLAAAALTWVILCKKSHPLLYFSVGIIMGLSIITKDSALILPGILLCWIIFRVLKGDMAVKRALTVSFIAILGVLLITQPVSRMNRIPGGGGEFTGKKSIIAMLSKPDLRNKMDRERYIGELNQEGDEFQVEVSQGGTFIDLMMSRGPDILKIIVINTGLGMKSLFLIVPWWLLLWIPIGIWFQWRRGDKSGFIFSIYLLTIIAGLIGFYSLAEAYTSALGSMRYTIPLIPFLILLVTSGIRASYVEIERYCIVRKLLFRPVGIGILCLLISIVFVSFISRGRDIIFLSKEKRWMRTNNQIIGEGIKDKIGQGHRIMSRNPVIPFHAGGLWVLTPYEPLDRVIKFARKKGVRLMVVQKEVDELSRPHIISLLKKDFFHPELRRILELPSLQEDGLIELAIYEVYY